jgi:hypothetical protein
MDQSVRDEWRNLGFWYDYTPQTGWVIRGSRAGLLGLAGMVQRYSQDESKCALSEHEHLGPHMYLEIVTWSSPEINAEGIFGTIEDLQQFARIIETRAQSAAPGSQFDLSAYAPSGPDRMTVTVEEDSFDPAGPDEEQ